LSSIVTIRLHTVTERRPPRLELATEVTARCRWEKEASNSGDHMTLRGAVSPAQYGGSPSRLPEQATTLRIHRIHASACNISCCISSSSSKEVSICSSLSDW
ncbi:hypothetical protein PpBr36_00569, partial [Pyricularia pennisetigena]|uniref:hypothetical protein n=1 Tax=Pyricularia pennisetigena TaxID=1578925 RepID=UPI0011535F53